MAKLSKEEADQLAALRAKEEAPEADDDDDGDDGGHVIVLRGSRADSFLESLIGPAKPVKKAAARNAGKPPATTEGDAEAETGTAETDEDAPPPKTSRYFR